jgi:hypothetical protein
MNPRPARAAVEDLVFSYHNDRVFLITHDTPLLRILETIAVAADISIHLMEPPTATLSIELYDRTLEDTLRALLLGSSYAVVYEAGTPPVVTYRQGTRTLPGVGPAAKTTGPRRTPAPGRSGGPSRTRPGTAPVTTDPGAVSGSDPSLPPGAALPPLEALEDESDSGGTGTPTASGTDADKPAGSSAASGEAATQTAAGLQSEADPQPGIQQDAYSPSTAVPPIVTEMIKQGASAGEINEHCQKRMVDLESRIASGLSDINYDHHFVLISGEPVSMHDEELLVMYENYVSSQ